MCLRAEYPVPTIMDISVVLATYNRAESLRITLESFSKLCFAAQWTVELLVVDNNSRDSTREVVQTFAAQVGFPVRYIFEKKQGRSAALNSGVLQARGAVIVFTDDDVIFHHEWLSNLKMAFDSCDCAAVAGRVIPQWNHAKPDWLEMDGQFAVVHFDLGDERREVQTPPLGANSAFRRGVFERYGLFRLDLGVNGSRHTVTCDDTEFGARLVQAGEKIVYSPNAIVYHPVDPLRTTKKYFLSWYYYNGVSVRRMSGISKEGVFWFGAPRWLYREMLANLGKWILTFQSSRRFSYKLRTYRSIGNIVESRRLSRDRAASS
jgi:glycosyltransferase involved in cell wall biosynthesis